MKVILKKIVEEVKKTMGYHRRKADTEETKALIRDGRKKFVRYDEGAILYSIGINSFRKIARESGAIYRIGGTVLVNTEIVDEYLEHFRDEY